MSLFRRWYRLKNGKETCTWNYDFAVRTGRYRGSFGKVSETRAKDLYARERTKALEGDWTPRKRQDPLLDAFAVEFLAWYRTQRSQVSYDRYRYAWVAIKPILGKRRLHELTDERIAKYVATRREMGRSVVTTNRELGFLVHPLRTAKRWGRIRALPFTEVTRDKELGRKRILSLEEEDRLLEAAREPLRSVIIIALDTGFRESEIVSLTPRSTDLAERLLTVENAYAKNRETGTNEMTVRVHAIVDRLLAKHPPGSDGPLCGYRQATSIKRAFRRTAARIGLPGVTFHTLRHTFCTRLLRKGVPLVIVQGLMRHKTVKMTMDYLTLTAGDLRGHIQVLNRETPPAISPAVRNEKIVGIP